MIDFVPLASSSKGCSYHLSGGGSTAPLLIDCGISFDKIQRALNFQTHRLAGCLVSHAHSDHCKAVKELMSRGTNCYASFETWKEIRRRKDDRCFGFPPIIYPHKAEKIGTWTVVAFEAVHDSPGTLGFAIDSPQGDRLLYLTDTMYSRYTIAGLTAIAIECNHSFEKMQANADAGIIDRSRFMRTARTHMSIERVEEFLMANDLSKVQVIWLLHLSADNADVDVFKDRIRKLTGIPVKVAEELSGACL